MQNNFFTVNKDLEPVKPRRRVSITNRNIVSFLKTREEGNTMDSSVTNEVRCNVVISEVEKFVAMEVNFSDRISSFCWHPAASQKNVCALGVRNGVIKIAKFLPESHKLEKIMQFPELEKGLSIYAMKFNPCKNNILYSCCWDSTVSARDIETGLITTLLSTVTPFRWYTDIDISSSGKNVVAACTYGHVFMTDTDTEKTQLNKRLHETRITSVQFCPRDNNLIATSSLDRTVKLWDFRNIKDCNSYLTKINYTRPTTLLFNPSGSILLTADQHKEIRLYSTSSWNMINLINHTFRQRVHIPHIQVSWHPHVDMILAEHYPNVYATKDTTDSNSIDFLCPFTGRVLYKLNEPNICLNSPTISVFNNAGDMLATTKGSALTLRWKEEEKSLDTSVLPLSNKKSLE